jgi:hypothetical protein
MSYRIKASGLFRNLALYVDRILKGAKPSDPIQRPTRFELVINARIYGAAFGPRIDPRGMLRAFVRRRKQRKAPEDRKERYRQRVFSWTDDGRSSIGVQSRSRECALEFIHVRFRQPQRQGRRILANVSRRPGLRNGDHAPAADRPGECDSGGAALMPPSHSI